MASVKMRRQVEQEIARRTIAACLAAGYSLSVYNGEDDEITESRDDAAILAVMFTTDEDYLFVYTDAGERFGWVRFIYGNDGWDVINDYTTNLETVLAPVNAYVDSIAD